MAAISAKPNAVFAGIGHARSTHVPAGGLAPLPLRSPSSAVLGGSSQALRGQALTLSLTSAVASGRVTRLPVAAAANNRRGGSGDQEFEEQVVQVRRVTKVVKGGKQLSFRAVVVVGDRKGTVGVGCASAKEVVTAVQKAAIVARRDVVKVPINRSESFPHRIVGRHGAAKVMLRPAAEGSGVIAGGATRVVLELAGVRNGFGKQLGTENPLNNARATIQGLSSVKTWKQVADARGLSVSYLLGLDKEEAAASA
uniref:Small ribosomal subunit protein uS5c n=1 Tax=Tetraselmis sp. GSL018 TaxID=582737 RepID=A0A061R1K2_9CHLO